MKANHCIAFIMLLLSFLFHNDAEAQRIRGDTIYVDQNNVVTVAFPSLPTTFQLTTDGQEGLYEVNDMGKNTLSIKALKKGAKEQALEVTEGPRKHLFILSYKEGSPALRFDYSKRKTLSEHVDEKKKEVSKALDAANRLYDQAINNMSNQALWEEVEVKYLRLVNAMEPKDAGIVKSRLEESRTHIQNLKGKKYEEAIKNGQNYQFLKKYSEAKRAYLKAKEHNPGDVQVLKLINSNDSVWAKEHVDKGDEANKAKKFIEAKTYYKDAFNIKPDYFGLQDKLNQARKDADPLIYKIEKTNLIQAMKANDTEEARRAYDSILFIYPNDGYTKSQLNKLIIEEKKIEEEEKKEAVYQGILTTAKSRADKASNVQEYDLAIKEYQRASDMIPTRKFPKKKIDELTKMKNGVRAN
jgi:tetratricopeptide (TPR) repeat protein